MNLHSGQLSHWLLSGGPNPLTALDSFDRNDFSLVTGGTPSRFGNAHGLKLEPLGYAASRIQLAEPNNRSMSWAFWLYSSGVAGTFVSNGDVIPVLSWKIAMDAFSGGQASLTFTASTDGFTVVAATESASPTVANLWRHLAITYNPTGNSIKFYWNGALASSAALATQLYNSGRAIFVGSPIENNYSNPGFLGLRDLRIWNRELPLSEVLAVYQGIDRGNASVSNKTPKYKSTNAKAMADIYNRGQPKFNDYLF